MINNSSGINNVALGADAAFYISTGSDNIVIGANAGSKLTTGSNNIDVAAAGVAGDRTPFVSALLRLTRRLTSPGLAGQLCPTV
jgi:hypothetical protein